MKQLLPLLILSVVLFSCKQKAANQPSQSDTTAKLNYPFKPTYSNNWEKGDEKNALIVLNCLKKYDDGDVKGCAESFADTAIFISDGFYFKGKRDSLMTIMAGVRAGMTTVSKEMESWLTTYYPDKKDTWVSLWYVEKWTDLKGKRDSLYYVDDVLLKNGKIVSYDEKVRHYPRPSPKKVK
jgi:hypothetical protein